MSNVSTELLLILQAVHSGCLFDFSSGAQHGVIDVRAESPCLLGGSGLVFLHLE